MFRNSIVRSARPANRAFSTTVRAMGAGDTGGIRSGGAASGDAFTKREKASEDYAVRQREHEKLLELKKKLADQHKSLKELESSIDAITKKQDAEKK